MEVTWKTDMENLETIQNDLVENARNALAKMVITFADNSFNFASDAFEPVKIIKSGECTIVFWKDNSKTIVRRDPEDADNLHTAFCAALAKKIFGSNTAVKKTIDRKLARSKEERRRIAYAKAIRAYKHKNHVNEVDSATKVKIYKEVHGIG